MKKSEALLMEKYSYMLQNNTEMAVSLVSSIYKQKNISEAQKLKLSQELVRQLRYGNDGYYYAYENSTGKNLIHGLNKNLEGKNLWNMQDPAGKQYIIRELDDVAKNNKVFLEFFWSKPGVEGIYPKLGTAMNVPGTNMWLGTGAYIDDINKSKTELRAAINKITAGTRLNFLLGFLIITPIAIMIIIFLSRNITNPIKHLITSTEAVSSGNYNVKIDARTDLNDAGGAMVAARELLFARPGEPDGGVGGAGEAGCLDFHFPALLAAESAAGAGGPDADLGFGDADGAGDLGAHDERGLGAAVDRSPFWRSRGGCNSRPSCMSTCSTPRKLRWPPWPGSSCSTKRPLAG